MADLEVTSPEYTLVQNQSLSDQTGLGKLDVGVAIDSSN